MSSGKASAGSPVTSALLATMMLFSVLLLLWVGYQYSNLQNLKTEIRELKDEVAEVERGLGVVQGDTLSELRQDRIFELDASFEVENVDTEMLKFAAPESRRVKRDVDTHHPEPEADHPIRHRKAKGRKGRENKNCMHMTLDQDAVDERVSDVVDCEAKRQEFRARNQSLICGVQEMNMWENQLRDSVAGELTHDRARLKVHKAGTYIVYAQVTYHDDFLPTAFQLKHDRGDGGPATMLSECLGQETIPSDLLPKQPHNKTYLSFNQCHTERAVRLEADDTVFVESRRNTSMIRAEPHLTFWGIWQQG